MKRALFYILTTSVLCSCAHVISRDLREAAVRDVPFGTVRLNVEEYIGSVFIWGGFIVGTGNIGHEAYMEIVQNPLNRYGGITDRDVSEGRFMAFTSMEMDPLIYEKGRMVTVAGELTGEKKIREKDREYAYPLLKVKDIHLWKEYDTLYAPFYPCLWYFPQGYRPYLYTAPY